MNFARTRLALAAAGSIFAFAAVAAELPAQGEALLTVDYSLIATKSMKMGDRTITQAEITGIIRNQSGSGPFHDASVRCLSTNDAVGDQRVGTGFCVSVDLDGDQFFHTIEGRGPTGKHIYIGGTGKYAGIKGESEYKAHPIKSPEGVVVIAFDHKITWKKQ